MVTWNNLRRELVRAFEQLELGPDSLRIFKQVMDADLYDPDKPMPINFGTHIVDEDRTIIDCPDARLYLALSAKYPAGGGFFDVFTDNLYEIVQNAQKQFAQDFSTRKPIKMGTGEILMTEESVVVDYIPCDILVSARESLDSDLRPVLVFDIVDSGTGFSAEDIEQIRLELARLKYANRAPDAETKWALSKKVMGVGKTTKSSGNIGVPKLVQQVSKFGGKVTYGNANPDDWKQYGTKLPLKGAHISIMLPSEALKNVDEVYMGDKKIEPLYRPQSTELNLENLL